MDKTYPGQIVWALAHWAIENDKLHAQQKNLLVPDDHMVLFLSLKIPSESLNLKK